MNAKLTSRDIEIILDVYKYRYLSVSQIEGLHFPSKLTTRRRLKVLTELGCLKPFTVPNIPERVYYLDKKGAEIAAIELHVDIEDLEWHRHTKQPKDYYFLKHFMAINDFRILLTSACLKSPMSLLGFIPDYLGEKTKEGTVKKYIRDHVCDIARREVFYSHTPDAVFALKKEDNAALFFVEIDRGIEIVSDPEKGFLKCIVFYLNYWVEKKWQRYAKDFDADFNTFRLLVVTTSQERMKHMREAVSRLPFSNPQVKRFLWCTLQSWATTENIFSPIWQSLDESDLTPYRIG